MIQFISDKMSAVLRILNFDNKKYNTTQGKQSPIIQGNNNTIGFPSESVTSRKQLINNVIIYLEKLDDNKKSEKACAPIIINLKDCLHQLRVDLQADEHSLYELVESLLQALKSEQYPSSQLQAIFKVFDANWHPLDKINFKAYFESIK